MFLITGTKRASQSSGSRSLLPATATLTPAVSLSGPFIAFALKLRCTNFTGFRTPSRQQDRYIWQQEIRALFSLLLDQHSFAERSSRAPLRMTRRCLATQTRPFRTGSERDCFAHRAGSSAKRARYFPFQFAYTCTGAIRTSRRAVGIRRAIHACSHQAWRAAGGRRPSVGTGVRCHS